MGSVTVQPADGKIVVTEGEARITRFNTNGSLDTDFGSGGRVTLPAGFEFSSLAIDSAGKIVAAGGVGSGSTFEFALFRFNVDGSPDSSFDGDGVAVDATNTIGGLSVKVLGATGETYNAHMSKIGELGPVHTGDVIGYVGDSGNAAGTPPHDHFEYRPETLPEQWPESAYGYSIVSESINPYPRLTAVC